MRCVCGSYQSEQVCMTPYKPRKGTGEPVKVGDTFTRAYGDGMLVDVLTVLAVDHAGRRLLHKVEETFNGAGIGTAYEVIKGNKRETFDSRKDAEAFYG